ncbi:MAG TPA: cytochrome c oxidase subunit 3 [Bryobacteraceae bacterium]|nr:cytochrome c oxidase subunit 3 [Bryobacteraceae bacterium]
MEPVIELAARERELNSLSNVTVGVVLGTVTMTFGAMIAVFVIRSEAPLFWGHLQVPGVLWATTAILIASSIFLERARHRLAVKDQGGFFKLTAIATGLGVLFLIGQITAWLQILHSGIVLENNPHSWFIFLFSGLHGLHIVAGLGGLAYLLVRTRHPAGGPKYQMKTRAVTHGVSIFWHYLDFLWILMFVLLVTWHR